MVTPIFAIPINFSSNHQQPINPFVDNFDYTAYFYIHGEGVERAHAKTAALARQARAYRSVFRHRAHRALTLCGAIIEFSSISHSQNRVENS